MGTDLRTATEYVTRRTAPFSVAWHFPTPDDGVWTGQGRGHVAATHYSTDTRSWWVGGTYAESLSVWSGECDTLSDARRQACNGGNGRRYAGHTAVRHLRIMTAVHMRALLWMPDNGFGWSRDKAWPNAGKVSVR